MGSSVGHAQRSLVYSIGIYPGVVVRERAGVVERGRLHFLRASSRGGFVD